MVLEIRSTNAAFQEAATTAIDQDMDYPTSPPDYPRDKVIASSQDRVTRLNDGRKLRIKGTQHAYLSIERGTAIIVTCPCCQTVLQVDASAKLILLLNIFHLTNLQRHPEENNAALHDYQIAGSVQQQEVDVACARKMAKMQH
jgi:hypothetical protein